MKKLLMGTLLALSLGCTKPASSAAVVAPSGPAENAGQVVATYGGKQVTLAQLDESISGKLEELDKQRFQARQQGLEQMIIQELVKAEAAKEGKTEEVWLKANIDSSIAAPPDAEIKKFFEENKAQMPPGSDFAAMKQQIADFMTRDQKRTVAMKVFDDLKKKANVTILLKEKKKAVEAIGPSRGPENAKVTIVEFSDFECPFCSRARDTMEQVMAAYAGKVRLVFRQFPLDFHPSAPKAAEAALCANEQKKFWEMHDHLFQNQKALAPEQLKEAAKTLGLDTAKFNECLEGGKMAATVQSDVVAGKKVGVSGTPAFFINGTMLSGALPMEEFKRVIDAELASAQ